MARGRSGSEAKIADRARPGLCSYMLDTRNGNHTCRQTFPQDPNGSLITEHPEETSALEDPWFHTRMP